jgi:hypothetical protein
MSTEALHTLATRSSESLPPTPVEVERALERGFGEVMKLEAELQAVGRQRGHDTLPHSCAVLVEEIRLLRAAMAQVRCVNGGAEVYPLAHGFVLPADGDPPPDLTRPSAEVPRRLPSRSTE